MSGTLTGNLTFDVAFDTFTVLDPKFFNGESNLVFERIDW